ncbi:MAG: aminotransferase class I/II-fold pyridoxal phosphate-dependent enzyme [Nitrospinae bacterium]|nr:aminotransferase class I/II-fold pyridoxal phosphate-dependent enzyme [Nitrospinota bacterium]
MVRVAAKVANFTESVIREMTRECLEVDGVNLAQGFPDFPAPEVIKEAAVRAIRDDVNQYAITWGSPTLRAAISEKTGKFNRIPCDPDAHVTVCCGATEAMLSALLAILDPGDEIIVFEPFYENYGPDAIICGARPRYVTLHPPDFSYDSAELSAAFSQETQAIIINTPHNPAGKVFTLNELEEIAELCKAHDVIAVTDEIYEHILYDGHRHVSIASLDGMDERTITISGCSKTYSVTGWRIGWCVASEAITGAIRKIHDFCTVGAPAPLQEAAAVALGLPDTFYEELRAMYAAKREFLLSALEEVGFKTYRPEGAYYILADIEAFGWEDDIAFALHLVRDHKIATVPGSSFYSRPELGRRQIRFTFSKRDETLAQAAEALRSVRPM